MLRIFGGRPRLETRMLFTDKDRLWRCLSDLPANARLSTDRNDYSSASANSGSNGKLSRGNGKAGWDSVAVVGIGGGKGKERMILPSSPNLPSRTLSTLTSAPSQHSRISQLLQAIEAQNPDLTWSLFTSMPLDRRKELSRSTLDDIFELQACLEDVRSAWVRCRYVYMALGAVARKRDVSKAQLVEVFELGLRVAFDLSWEDVSGDGEEEGSWKMRETRRMYYRLRRMAANVLDLHSASPSPRMAWLIRKWIEFVVGNKGHLKGTRAFFAADASCRVLLRTEGEDGFGEHGDSWYLDQTIRCLDLTDRDRALNLLERALEGGTVPSVRTFRLLLEKVDRRTRLETESALLDVVRNHKDPATLGRLEVCLEVLRTATDSLESQLRKSRSILHCSPRSPSPEVVHGLIRRLTKRNPKSSSTCPRLAVAPRPESYREPTLLSLELLDNLIRYQDERPPTWLVNRIVTSITRLERSSTPLPPHDFRTFCQIVVPEDPSQLPMVGRTHLLYLMRISLDRRQYETITRLYHWSRQSGFTWIPLSKSHARETAFRRPTSGDPGEDSKTEDPTREKIKQSSRLFEWFFVASARHSISDDFPQRLYNDFISDGGLIQGRRWFTLVAGFARRGDRIGIEVVVRDYLSVNGGRFRDEGDLVAFLNAVMEGENVRLVSNFFWKFLAIGVGTREEGGSVRVGIEVFNAVLEFLSTHPEQRLAKELDKVFDSIYDHRLSPDWHSYDHRLRAIVYGQKFDTRDLEKVRSLYDSMIIHTRLRPTGATFGHLIIAFARVGELDNAMNVLEVAVLLGQVGQVYGRSIAYLMVRLSDEGMIEEAWTVERWWCRPGWKRGDREGVGHVDRAKRYLRDREGGIVRRDLADEIMRIPKKRAVGWHKGRTVATRLDHAVAREGDDHSGEEGKEGGDEGGRGSLDEGVGMDVNLEGVAEQSARVTAPRSGLAVMRA